MTTNPKKNNSGPISVKNADERLPIKISEKSGVIFNRCYHCRSCTNGCPFLKAMDYYPNEVIRLLQLGQTEEVLNCSTIWTCVGCNTCSYVCPMAIDIPALMDSLRQSAIAEGIISEPDVLNFHNEVLDSIERHGRTHKLEIMLRYKVKTRDWFGDLDVGLKMMAKRKLDLSPSRVTDLKRIRRLFSQNRMEQRHE
ncbi:MAG: 4Fe-4S dicluster domain-containing protein [Desulfobacteraceae bacterium]|nr:4Fe-4S dicluster domain-containing protein [Desulfobacteraceae bacterium]